MKMPKSIEQDIDHFKHCLSHYKTLRFFLSSQDRYLTYLYILQFYFDKKELSLEELINKICPKFASRETVKNILNQAIGNQFIEKKIHSQDKRKKSFVPTSITLKEYDWYEKGKK